MGLPVQFTPQQRSSRDQLIAQLNADLPWPALLSTDDGAAIKAHALLDEDGTISSEVVHRMVLLCFEFRNRHLPELLRIAEVGV